MGGALSLAILVPRSKAGYVARRGVGGRAPRHRVADEMGMVSAVGRGRAVCIVVASDVVRKRVESILLLIY
jgi:hypothetical protein